MGFPFFMMYLFYPNPVTPGFLPAEAKLSEIMARKNRRFGFYRLLVLGPAQVTATHVGWAGVCPVRSFLFYPVGDCLHGHACSDNRRHCVR